VYILQAKKIYAITKNTFQKYSKITYFSPTNEISFIKHNNSDADFARKILKSFGSNSENGLHSL